MQKILDATSQFGEYDEKTYADFIKAAKLAWPELKLELAPPQLKLEKLGSTLSLVEKGDAGEEAPQDVLKRVFNIIIDCENEEQQLTILEKLQKEGHKCRAIVS